MIDIHCHILPAVDDGPAVMSESVRMAALAAADGITHLVASPHISCGQPPACGNVLAALDAFKEEVAGQEITLAVLSGADVRFTYELMAAIEKREVPTINGSRYFLLELPELFPRNMDTVLFSAVTQGYLPVITHPERNPSLLSAPEKVAGLRDAGCLFQITAMSITGEFGPDIQAFSMRLLREGLADFVASDCHDVSYRPPLLSRAYREVRKGFGPQRAGRLFVDNPRAIIEDREVIVKGKE